MFLRRLTDPGQLSDSAPGGSDTATKQADFFKWGFGVHCDDGHVGHDGIL